MANINYRLDPATKGFVVISETTINPDDLRTQLQTACDESQNRYNQAADDLKAKEEAHKQAEENLISARQELEEAGEELSFSETRLKEFDEELRLRDELLNADPTSENATSTDEVAIPVTVAETAEV